MYIYIILSYVGSILLGLLSLSMSVWLAFRAWRSINSLTLIQMEMISPMGDPNKYLKLITIKFLKNIGIFIGSVLPIYPVMIISRTIEIGANLKLIAVGLVALSALISGLSLIFFLLSFGISLSAMLNNTNEEKKKT